MQTRLHANIVLIVLSRAPQQEPHAVYIFPRCHLRDQKLPTPSVSGRKPDISHLAACQVSHGKERDLPVSWHPCWQGQQSGKQDPLTHQGKPWGRVSKTPVRFFFFFRRLGVERRQPSLCSESKAVYFHAFKRQNHLSPHKGKKREDGRGLRASLARQPQRGGWGLGGWGGQQHRSTARMLKCSPHRPSNHQRSTPDNLRFRHIQVS